jgi:hypothetical protein
MSKASTISKHWLGGRYHVMTWVPTVTVKIDVFHPGHCYRRAVLGPGLIYLTWCRPKIFMLPLAFFGGTSRTNFDAFLYTIFWLHKKSENNRQSHAAGRRAVQVIHLNCRDTAQLSEATGSSGDCVPWPWGSWFRPISRNDFDYVNGERKRRSQWLPISGYCDVS